MGNKKTVILKKAILKLLKKKPNKPFVDDIGDDEVRFLGDPPKQKRKKSNKEDIAIRYIDETEPYVDDMSDDKTLLLSEIAEARAKKAQSLGDDISNDEIRVIGGYQPKRKKSKTKGIKIKQIDKRELPTDDIGDDEIRFLGKPPKVKRTSRKVKKTKIFTEDIGDDEIRIIGGYQPKDKWYKKLISKGR